MIQLSDEQLNNLGKKALVVIVSSLQDQLLALQSQLDHANAQLSDNNRQIERKRLIFRYDRKIPDYFSVAGAP